MSNNVQRSRVGRAESSFGLPRAPQRGRGIRSSLYSRRGAILSYLVITGYVLVSMFPIVWMLLSSFKPPADFQTSPPRIIFEPTLYNYSAVLGFTIPGELTGTSGVAGASDTLRFPNALKNSLIIGFATTSVALVIGSLAAYALTRVRARWRGSLLTGILITRLIPPIVILVPLYVTWRSLDLIDTYVSLSITYLTFGLPFTIWMMRGFFVSVPVELEEAARIDGCSRMGAFLRIVLPLAAPGLAATGVFAMITSWNEFLFATLLTGANTRTLPPVILTYISDDAVLWGFLYAAASITVVPVLGFSLLMQKYVATGLTGGAVKG